MLSTSFAYRRHVADGGRVELKATLTLADGTVHNLTGEDFVMGGYSLTEATSSASGFDIGAAIIGTSIVTLANHERQWDDADFTGATIVVHVGVDFGETEEWLRRGTYGVEQPSGYASTIKLSLYDNMRLFEKDYSEVDTAYPATLLTIVDDICDECGVTMLDSSFPRDSYVVQERPGNESTSCLDVLAWAMQVACCWARMDPWGRLECRWYDTAAFEGEDWLDGGTFDTDTTPYSDGDTADGGGFHTDVDDADGGSFATNEWALVRSIGSLTTTTDDVVVTGVEVTASAQATTDGTQGADGETYLYGTAGYVLKVEGNPLIEYGQAEDVAEVIGAAVVGMRFRPLTVAAIGDPAWQAGDPMLVIDQFGRTHHSWITQLTWKAGGYESLQCSAETPARLKADSYSAQTRAIVQQRNTAHAEATVRAQAIAALADQLAEASGLYETDEEQLDGSVIRYFHDKPTLAESQIVWQFTANAFAFSTDGGTTYPYGIDVTGMAILDRVYAIGIDARYINAGRVAFDNGGWIDFELGTMGLGNLSYLGDKTVEEVRADIEDARRMATDYLTYSNGELILGATDSAIKNVMTNTSQRYRTDAGDVAWFGLNDSGIWEMYIETASVQNRLSFGDFSWIARQNGNMTLKWVGA